jgi:CBS domain containing-hemolysin-like protein
VVSETDSWQEWLLLTGLILVNALFSAAEIAISSVAARAELRNKLEQDQGSTARLLLRLAEDSTRLLSTVRIGVTLAGFFAAASAALTLHPLVAQWMMSSPLSFSATGSNFWGFFLVVFVLACVMVFLGELLPKSLADHHPYPVALALAWPMQLMIWLFFPLTRFLVGLNSLIVRFLGGTRPVSLPYVTEDEIRTFVDAGEEGGVIEWDEKEMIDGILEMGKTLVREVMVPRTDIVAFDVETSLLEALDTIVQAGYSRIPVFQGTIDHIVGLLYAKDLLPALRDGDQDRLLHELLRPGYFVPETKVVDDMLRELQQQRIHLAIVVDEYGGTAGVVTIEDLLEEIVGEIQDEYDTEEPLIEELGPGEYLCDARLSVDDANKLASVEIPEGDFDTLGGLIYDRLGAIPKVGDQVVIGEVVITVASIDGLRPGKLHIRLLKAPRAVESEEEVRKEVAEDGS